MTSSDTDLAWTGHTSGTGLTVKLSPFFTTVLILGACSSNSSEMRGLALAGTGGSVPIAGFPSGAAGTSASGPAGTGASGTVGGISGQGAPGTGTGTGVAGSPVTAAAGTGAAGSPIGAAGQPAAAGGGATAGTSGAAGAAGMPAAGSGASVNATVMVEFTTLTYGGEYAPLNYGAVWFEDPSKKFIKTAKRWAGTVHARDLTTWTMASGGWPSALGSGGNSADRMDAVSMATLRTHQKHMVTWNMKNAMMQVVPDGDYVAVLEVTEDRGAKPGPVLRVPFKKTAAPQTVEVPNEKSFTGVVLRYTP
jgi:hypothetical protein